ncbi:hypothetical protein ATCV1_z191R [Acanthocystis turfacea chlorella virus 1]|uniref:Uncharacterized protein z191R n=1 Tax=Chlorovirus heliozoae TaxID=322019 RepID=A7K8F1_9PHYC|nr:hypothetical protein ATCV1_z191R [Acanthocystis turfacea chlorella virus 1]ABT16325.1 hypothetical protein ATCV1_z191R [Acanthocystis turfacea chlorella virus 1]
MPHLGIRASVNGAKGIEVRTCRGAPVREIPGTVDMETVLEIWFQPFDVKVYPHPFAFLHKPHSAADVPW